MLVANTQIYKKITQVLFVLSTAILLFFLVREALPNYPTGWDSPYYIARSKYLIEEGILTNRVGLIGVLSALHELTQIPFITLQWFTQIALIFILALLSGLIALQLQRNQPAYFIVPFLFVLWSASYFVLSISTADNALGIIFTLAVVYLMIQKNNNILNHAGVMLFALGLALTHIESLAVTLATVAMYSLIRYWQIRSIREWWKETRPVLMAMGFAIIVVILQWWSVIGKIIRGYTTTANPGGNASIPFSDNPTLSAWAQYAQTGIKQNPEAILFALGIVFILYLTWSRKRSAAGIASVIIVAYGILLFSVLRSSIPINRSLLLLPTAWIIGIGLAAGLSTLRHRYMITATLLVSLGLMIWLPVKFYSYAKGFPISINHRTYQGYMDLQSYVNDNSISSFVLITNTSPDERAAGAYYGLWTNWKLSLLPLPTSRAGSCVYLGTVENYLAGQSTRRETNTEYTGVSEYTLECIQILPEEPVSFVIPSLYPDTLAPNGGYTVVPISENLLRVVGNRTDR